jgi:DNA modification methylase
MRSPNVQILEGDALAVLRTLRGQSINCCVTSPPYWGLRDYGVPGQMGLEKTPEQFVTRLVEVFREVRRVLRDDGTLWLNLGDSYNSQPGQRSVDDKVGCKQATNRGSNDTGSRACPGLKPKDLVGIPWRVAFALQADGWYLRSDIIWHKPNPMPESVTDRPTKAHEYLFLLAKSEKYYCDMDAIKEPTTGSAHDRARKDRSVAGQKTLPTAERNGMRAPGVNPKAFHASGNKARKLAGPENGRFNTHMGIGFPWPPAIRPKQNESFSAAVTRTVERRNKRTVWTIPTKSFKGAHFATYPPKLVEPCILAGCPKGGTVLDCFAGAGTTGLVSRQHGRRFIGIELNPEYAAMARAPAA